MTYCKNCGKEVADGAVICPNCGVQISALKGEQKEKSPALAALLSLLIVGVGQFYNGDWLKGFGFMVAAVFCALIFFPVVVVVWVAAMADAYLTAQKKNEEIS
jgi:TM2 domain-containing membrane protein YozV